MWKLNRKEGKIRHDFEYLRILKGGYSQNTKNPIGSRAKPLTPAPTIICKAKDTWLSVYQMQMFSQWKQVAIVVYVHEKRGESVKDREKRSSYPKIQPFFVFLSA